MSIPILQYFIQKLNVFYEASLENYTIVIKLKIYIQEFIFIKTSKEICIVLSTKTFYVSCLKLWKNKFIGMWSQGIRENEAVDLFGIYNSEYFSIFLFMR